MAPPRIGHGLAVEVALEVPAGSLDYWGARLDKYRVPLGAVEQRFGDTVLPVIDPHGLSPKAFGQSYTTFRTPVLKQVESLRGVPQVSAQRTW